MRQSLGSLLLAAVLALAYGAGASAQAATPASAALSYGAVTTYTDGTAVSTASPVTYTIFQGVQGGTLTQIATGVSGTSYTATANLTPGTTQCFTVRADQVGASSSAQSVQACAAIPLETLNAPTSIVITFTPAH